MLREKQRKEEAAEETEGREMQKGTIGKWGIYTQWQQHLTGKLYYRQEDRNEIDGFVRLNYSAFSSPPR